MTDPLVHTRVQTCKRLGISETTLKTLVKTGQIAPSYRIGDRPYWTEADLRTWVAARSEPINVSAFGPSRARKGPYAKRTS